MTSFDAMTEMLLLLFVGLLPAVGVVLLLAAAHMIAGAAKTNRSEKTDEDSQDEDATHVLKAFPSSYKNENPHAA